MLNGNEQAVPEPGNAAAILLVTAGTSDLPVAEEARVTLRCLGRKVATIYDAGVAGIHRILHHQENCGERR